MSIDIIVHANTVQDLVDFALTHPAGNPLAVEQDDGEGGTFIVRRPGFAFYPWGGDGRYPKDPRTLQASGDVDVIQGNRFGFTVPNQPWLQAGVTAEKDGEVIGTFFSYISGNAVFDAVGDLPEIGETLDIYTPLTFVPGVTYLFQIFPPYAQDDRLEYVPDNEDDDSRDFQDRRSKLVEYVKNNVNGSTGTTTEGIPYLELDGVRIFKPKDAVERLQSLGIPGWEMLGGNNY